MRYRAASLVVVVLLVASVAAGCGASQGAATGSSGSVPPTSAPSATQTTLPGVGDSVDFQGNSWPNMDVLVTVDAEQYWGGQANDWGVQLTIKNQGQESYTDNFTPQGESGPVTLWGADGKAYYLDERNYWSNALGQVHVLPGSSATGWVYFYPIPDSSSWKPESFQLAPAGSGMTGEWKFPSE